jgi:succinoglycan biosynthesis transport protein ExoP
MDPESRHLLDYLRPVRERWRLVALMVVLTTGIALGVSLSSEKQYEATAQLLLRRDEPINSLLNPTSAGQSSDPERDLNTEVALIKVAPTARAAQRALGLRRSANALLDQVQTETSSTSDIVRVTARDHDPVLAARIANAFAEAYVQFRVESARARYRQAADLAQRQLLSLSPVARDSAEGRELSSRQRELQIASALQTGGAELVRAASVPASPSRPRPKLSGAVGLFLGLILGVGAALSLSLFDRRFKDEQEVEEFFGLPVRAAIQRPARRGKPLQDAGQREGYGLLAANLGLLGAGRTNSTVMITSPGPGEGKTSVTLGIARACAQLGLKVIAIEADLRRPAFARYTDVTASAVTASAGLTGVLAGSFVARELIWIDPATLQHVEDPADEGLIGLLPAGELPANPQRVLSDPAMNSIVHVARSLADVVLIDTAPLGIVNDSAGVVRIVDGVVVVARLNHTTKDAARRTSRTLDSLDAEVLGLVITDAGGADGRAYYSATEGSAPPVKRARNDMQGGRV